MPKAPLAALRRAKGASGSAAYFDADGDGVADGLTAGVPFAEADALAEPEGDGVAEPDDDGVAEPEADGVATAATGGAE